MTGTPRSRYGASFGSSRRARRRQQIDFVHADHRLRAAALDGDEVAVDEARAQRRRLQRDDVNDDVDVRGDEPLHVLVQRIGTRQHRAPRQDVLRGARRRSSSRRRTRSPTASALFCRTASSGGTRSRAPRRRGTTRQRPLRDADHDRRHAVAVSRRRRLRRRRRVATAARGCRRSAGRLARGPCWSSSASQLSSVTRCAPALAFVFLEDAAHLAGPLARLHLVVRADASRNASSALRFAVHDRRRSNAARWRPRRRGWPRDHLASPERQWVRSRIS